LRRLAKDLGSGGNGGKVNSSAGDGGEECGAAIEAHAVAVGTGAVLDDTLASGAGELDADAFGGLKVGWGRH